MLYREFTQNFNLLFTLDFTREVPKRRPTDFRREVGPCQLGNFFKFHEIRCLLSMIRGQIQGPWAWGPSGSSADAFVLLPPSDMCMGSGPLSEFGTSPRNPACHDHFMERTFSPAGRQDSRFRARLSHIRASPPGSRCQRPAGMHCQRHASHSPTAIRDVADPAIQAIQACQT